MRKINLVWCHYNTTNILYQQKFAEFFLRVFCIKKYNFKSVGIFYYKNSRRRIPINQMKYNLEKKLALGIDNLFLFVSLCDLNEQTNICTFYLLRLMKYQLMVLYKHEFYLVERSGKCILFSPLECNRTHYTFKRIRYGCRIAFIIRKTSLHKLKCLEVIQVTPLQNTIEH